MKDFEYLRLKEDASKLIVQEFEDRLKQIITHKDLNRKISYQSITTPNWGYSKKSVDVSTTRLSLTETQLILAQG